MDKLSCRAAISAVERLVDGVERPRRATGAHQISALLSMAATVSRPGPHRASPPRVHRWVRRCGLRSL